MEEDLALFSFPIFAPIEWRPRDEGADWGWFEVAFFTGIIMLGLRMIDRNAELSDARRLVEDLLGTIPAVGLFGGGEITVLAGTRRIFLGRIPS